MGCGVFLTHSRDRDSIFFINAWSIPVACTTDVVRIHGGFATFDCLIKQPFELTAFTMQVLIIEETQLREKNRVFETWLSLPVSSYCHTD